MTTYKIWENDRYPVAFQAQSSEGPVNFNGSTVRLIAKPADGSNAIDLACTATGDTVNHTLDGLLGAGIYSLVTEATTPSGRVITYPDAKTGPLILVVKRDLG